MKYICIYIITFFRAIYSKCETKDIDNFNKELAYLTNLYNNISDYNCTENYYFELLNRNYYRVLLEYYNSLLSKADILRAECVSPDNDTTITTIDNAKTGLNSKKTILESNHNDKQTCMSVNQLVAGNHCYNKQYKGYLPSKKSDDVMITRHVDAKLDTIAPFILTDDKFSSSFNTAEIYIGHFYYGGISIRVCEHENCESSIFNGINIAYFGDNCYHVDYFIINEYIKKEHVLVNMNFIICILK